jgi:hypothetical protein
MSEPDQHRPTELALKINFTAALGEAGHECADLGVEDTPDSGPLLRDAGQAGISQDQVADALGPLTLGALGRVPEEQLPPDAGEAEDS